MPFAMRFKLDTPSLRATLSRLRGVKLGRRNSILRTACNKSCRVVAKSAGQHIRDSRKERTKTARSRLKKWSGAAEEERAFMKEHARQLKQRTGLLKKSLGFVVKVYESTVIGVIGPRRGFKQQIGARTRNGKKSKKGDPIYEDPALIAHLVEFGHSGPHPAPAYPFMRPAWESSVSRIEQIFSEEVSRGITSLIEKGKY